MEKLYDQEIPADRLWPATLSLWMSVGYLFLFLIRPWEQLFPWLAVIHPERSYMVCLVAVIRFSGGVAFKLSKNIICVLCFFCAMLISSLFAYDSEVAWTTVYRYFTHIVFYLILLSVIRNLSDLIFVFICYIATMWIYLAKSLYEFFFHGRHYYTMSVTRLIGIEDTYGGPNDLSMSIAISLTIAVFLWSSRHRLYNCWSSLRGNIFPAFLLSYFVIAISAIVLTNSRSGFVTLVFFVLLLLLRFEGFARKVYFFLGMIILLFGLWFMIPEENKGRLRTIWEPESGPENAQTSAYGRIEGFKAGIKMLDQFPLTGVGPGNFIAYRVPNLDGIPLQAHNLAGQSFGELGLMGASPFLITILMSLARCKKIRKSTRGRPGEASAISGAIANALHNGILLLLFAGLFSHNLYRYNWLWFFAFVELLKKYSVDVSTKDYT